MRGASSVKRTWARMEKRSSKGCRAGRIDARARSNPGNSKDPLEEHAHRTVGVLLEVEDVAAVLVDETGDGGHDAGLVLGHDTSSTALRIHLPPQGRRTTRPGQAPVCSPPAKVITPASDGCPVAVGSLGKSFSAGRKVVGHDGRTYGETLEVDDVDVSLATGRQGAPVVQAVEAGRCRCLHAHQRRDREQATGPAVSTPMGQKTGREGHVADLGAVGTPVTEAGHGKRGLEQLADDLAIAGGEVPAPDRTGRSGPPSSKRMS